MDNIIHNLPFKGKSTKAAALAVLLVFSMTLPLFAIPVASAAPTLSISPTSGPNGTTVRVTGAGWNLAAGIQTAQNTPFTVTIDGVSTKALTYTGAITSGATTIRSPLSAGTGNVNLLQVNATTGAFTGYFVIGGPGGFNLAPGVHTIQITDTVGDVSPPVTFTITSPTVALNPATGPAGTPVNITGAGFPTGVTGVSSTIFSDNVTASSFGNPAPTAIQPPVVGAVVLTYTGTSTISGGSLTLTPPLIVSSLPIIVGTGTLQPDVGQTWTAAGTLTGTFTCTVGGLPATGTIAGAGTGGLLPASAVGTQNAASVNVVITVTAPLPAGIFNVLSSNAISSGAYVGTVSLPALAAGSTPVFTLTDAWGNIATTTNALNVPTVTLSPASGPIGTTVTVTGTGFGPGATFSAANTKFGATAASAIVPAAPVATEQGTVAFLAVVPAGGGADSVGGSHTVTITDSLGNVATATFTVTPAALITLGAGATDSGTTYAPPFAVSPANVHIVASGFRPSSAVTITGSPGVPTEWTASAGYTIVGGIGALTAGVLYTDASGRLSAYSANDVVGDAPAAGTYSVTITDGTNTQTAILTIVSSGNIIAATPTSGAVGTTVTLTYFGTAPTGISFDATAITPAGGFPLAAAGVWPTVTAATFTVPSSSAGSHIITATGAAFNAVFFTTLAPSVAVVSPSTTGVGQTVTVIGSNYALATSLLAIDGVSVATTSSAVLAGKLIVTFVMPNFLPGAHSVSLSDLSGGIPQNTANSSVNIVAPTIAVNPTSSVLTTATSTKRIGISGSGFAAGAGLTISFDGFIMFQYPSAGTYNSTVGLGITNNQGGILLLSNIAIPTNAPAGTHTITVTAVSGGSATTTYTIVPQIALAPSALRAPGVSAITGTGFAPNSPVTLTMNGTAALWFNTATTANTTTITTNAAGDIPANAAVILPASAVAGALPIVVADASGNSATATLTSLGNPAITLGASQAVAGVTVSISGSGFSPGAGRGATAQLVSGSTVLATITLGSATVTVGSAGTFGALVIGTTAQTMTVPTTVAAGTYTVMFTLAASGVLPAETANATLTILGAPTATPSVSTTTSGGNVSLTVVGLTAITTATIGAAAGNLVTAGVPQVLGGVTLFGSVTVPTTGANAYSLTTWFIAPTNLPAANYSLTLSDGTRTAVTAITITPAVTATPATGIKGAVITMTGTGFAASSTFSVSVNGVVVVPAVVGTTTTAGANGGALPAGVIFALPATAIANNTVTVTDASGNTATTYVTLTTPTLTINPTSGNVGTTVQLLGTGYTGASPIIVQVGGSIVTTSPATLGTTAAGSFIAYVQIPVGAAGNITISATDINNNVGTATFTVGGTVGGIVVDTATLASTAATQTASGTPATSFARGTTVKFAFVLQSTSGAGSVVFRVTLKQPDQTPYVVSSTATVSPTPSSPFATFPLLAGAPTGSWTAQIQIYASDGVTPLGATTLTFTVT